MKTGKCLPPVTSAQHGVAWAWGVSTLEFPTGFWEAVGAWRCFRELRGSLEMKLWELSFCGYFKGTLSCFRYYSEIVPVRCYVLVVWVSIFVHLCVERCKVWGKSLLFSFMAWQWMCFLCRLFIFQGLSSLKKNELLYIYSHLFLRYSWKSHDPEKIQLLYKQEFRLTEMKGYDTRNWAMDPYLDIGNMKKSVSV